MNESLKLTGVDTIYQQINVNTQDWNQPFNQVAFVNLGPNTFTVNLFPVPTGKQHVIALNVGEINLSTYNIDFQGATDRQCWIIYTRYNGVKI